MKHNCGAWWTPSPIRRVLSIKFDASCKIHDLDYESSRFDKVESDTRFLMHMIRQSNGSLFWETVATFYYLTTRLLGKLSWQTKHSPERKPTNSTNLNTKTTSSNEQN